MKIIDTATKQVVSAQGETYFTIAIQLGQVDLKEFYHKGVKLTAVDGINSFTAAGQYYYDSTTGVVTFTTKDFSTFTAVFKFAGGNGTADHPYLIANKGHFAAINDEYDAQKFNYYKVANGVDALNISGVGKIALYGEFDGNNAEITTNQGLFNTVGIGNTEQTASVIKNMTVEADHSVSAVVRTVGSKELTFENVKVSGEIENNTNNAAFVNYGTCNFDEKGWNYTINFKNCSCDAKVIARGETFATILVAHPYQGSGNTATINLDSSTDENISSAKLYAVANNGGTATGYKYYGNDSWTVEVYVGNSETDARKGTHEVNVIKAAAPVKGENGKYTVTTDSNAKSMVVQVLSQLTAYNEENEQVANLNGITNTNGTCYSGTVNGEDTVDVFGKVNSVVIQKGLTDSGHPEYTLDEGGKLTIKTNSTDNYLTGTIRLGAYQYNESGELISCGTLDIAKSEGTPGTTGSVTWKVS